MKKLGLLVLISIIAAGSLMATGGRQAAPAGKTIRIGMANLALGDYFTGMRNAVVAAGQQRGWTVNATNADGDDAKLVSDVENFIAQRVDGIIISGAWFNDIPAALNAAQRAGIPVVLVDRMFDSQNFTAWVGPDNEFMGEQVGRYIVSQLPAGGTAVIIRGGPPENTIGINRTKGVTSALTAAGWRHRCNYSWRPAREYHRHQPYKGRHHGSLGCRVQH